MMWQAPAAYRGGQTAASHIDMNGETEGRVRFAMKGATPFKGNFIAYYDFKSVSNSSNAILLGRMRLRDERENNVQIISNKIMIYSFFSVSLLSRIAPKIF